MYCRIKTMICSNEHACDHWTGSEQINLVLIIMADCDPIKAKQAAIVCIEWSCFFFYTTIDKYIFFFTLVIATVFFSRKTSGRFLLSFSFWCVYDEYSTHTHTYTHNLLTHAELHNAFRAKKRYFTQKWYNVRFFCFYQQKQTFELWFGRANSQSFRQQINGYRALTITLYNSGNRATTSNNSRRNNTQQQFKSHRHRWTIFFDDSEMTLSFLTCVYAFILTLSVCGACFDRRPSPDSHMISQFLCSNLSCVYVQNNVLIFFCFILPWLRLCARTRNDMRKSALWTETE